MAHDPNLCTKCRNPLSFKPRVDVNLRLDPSMSSSLEMRETISLCDEDLDDYDTEINRLQNQIIQLQAQRNRLNDYKSQLQSFGSAFWKLPNETLCIIFESICAENLLQDRSWPSDSEKEPITHSSLSAITYLPALAISAVCTRWRSLALASPNLWSQLTLNICRNSGTRNTVLNDGLRSVLQYYLHRSENVPLMISLQTTGYKCTCHDILRLLLDHTGRWKTFSYSGDYTLDGLFDFDRPFHILENIALKGDQAELSRWDFIPFAHAPKLLTVVTGGQITDLPHSWKRLISLKILNSLCPQEMSYLQDYPDLIDLNLMNPWNGFGTGITYLAKLESFTFGDSLPGPKENVLSNMFSSMTFPSLKELVIDSENTQPRLIWPPDAFSAFISRSTCILTTLSLRFVWISDQSLIAAFRILPSLVNFSIDDFLDPQRESPITPHFVSCMSASSPTPVLPRLRFLSITAYNVSFDDAAFVDMVSSRWLPGSSAAAIGIDCLRSLVLHLPTREVDEEIYRRFENLDSMGMQVVVTGKEKCAPGTKV